jgi:hypothetical protein
MNWLSLSINRFKVETSRQLLIDLQDIAEYSSIQNKEKTMKDLNNGFILETIGSRNQFIRKNPPWTLLRIEGSHARVW